MNRMQAEEIGVNIGRLKNIEYKVADLNEVEFNEGEYDLIWANGALHHIKELKIVIPMLYKSLKPGSYLISNEFVGPNYQRLSLRQQEIINAVKHITPHDLRFTSNNVIPTLNKYFDEVEVKYFGGSIMAHALDKKFYDDFDLSNTNHRKFLEMIFKIEDTLIDIGEIKSDNAHIICKKIKL